MNLKIKADDTNLDAVNNFIHKMIPENCSVKILNELDLAVEEIFVNIAHYAYKDLPGEQKTAGEVGPGSAEAVEAGASDEIGTGAGGRGNFGFAEIFCNFDLQSSVLTIEFCDWGVPFNPLKKEDPDLSLSAEERKIGGLGIFLTKKFMDSLTYKYENYQNKLKITKKIQ